MSDLRADQEFAVKTGYTVFTADGNDIGTVKEVRGTAFKVDASLHPDYWLNTASVQSCSDDRVTLSFTASNIDLYKRNEPAETEGDGGEDVSKTDRMEQVLDAQRETVIEDPLIGTRRVI